MVNWAKAWVRRHHPLLAHLECGEGRAGFELKAILLRGHAILTVSEVATFAHIARLAALR